MSAGLVAMCDGTLGSGAHIPAGKSSHIFSRKPAPVLWWVNINGMNDTWRIRLSPVWAVEPEALLYYRVYSVAGSI